MRQGFFSGGLAGEPSIRKGRDPAGAGMAGKVSGVAGRFLANPAPARHSKRASDEGGINDKRTRLPACAGMTAEWRRNDGRMAPE